MTNLKTTAVILPEKKAADIIREELSKEEQYEYFAKQPSYRKELLIKLLSKIEG